MMLGSAEIRLKNWVKIGIIVVVPLSDFKYTPLQKKRTTDVYLPLPKVSIHYN